MSTKNATQKNKTSAHSKNFKLIPKLSKLAWFFIVCGIVVIGLTIYSIIVISNQPKILTKDQAKEFLQKQANGINLPGEAVYEKLEDNGCYLAAYFSDYDCTYTLKKYYRHSGSKEADIVAAENALIRGGCEKNKDYISTGGMERHFIVPNEGYASCAIRIFSLDKKDIYDNAKEFFNINQDIPLQDNEYTYGIFMSREYEYDPNVQ